MRYTIFFNFLMFSISCSEAKVVKEEVPLMKTVSYVELDRYVGRWYEIAKFPNRFQHNCFEATAEYTKLENGNIEVHNTCKKTSNGKWKDIFGVAKVADFETNAKLVVSFLPAWLRWTGIGSGNYWIIDLEPNYEYAVVSEPNREYLWILSRTPSLKSSTYQSILKKIVAQNLDVNRLEFSRENAIQD